MGYNQQFDDFDIIPICFSISPRAFSRILTHPHSSTGVLPTWPWPWQGLKQPIMLGIHRSDYMLHEGSETSEPRFLQVELNTIASSMGAHALNVPWRQIQPGMVAAFDPIQGIAAKLGRLASPLLGVIPFMSIYRPNKKNKINHL